MAFEVLLTDHAVRDLEEIEDWISSNDAPSKALHVLERIETVMRSLATHPDRGAHPRELLDLGIREYRETFFKPYRIIYRVQGKKVVVHLIADGRRDMQALLARRVLEA
jgi:toxin ParE1/3/4